MTLDTSRFGPPVTISGAAAWFGRNVAEALIWACAGAAVLFILMLVHNDPPLWGSLLLAVVCFGWAWFGGWRVATPGRQRVLEFAFLRFAVRVVVVRMGDGSQKDRL